MAIGPNDFMLKNVRLSFPKLWTAELYPGGKDPTKYFSAVFLIPKGDPQIKALEALMVRLANEKWGAKGPTVLKLAKANGKVFMRDGDAKDQEGYEGHMFVSARSKTRPTVFDQAREPIQEEQGIIYAGCYVNAKISCYPYTKGNNGLGAGLKGVQFWKDGDAFSGGGKPADAEEFDELSVEDAEDLTA